VSLKAGESRELLIPVRRGSYAGPVELSFAGLPPGVVVEPGTVPAGEAARTATVRAAPDAAPGEREARVAAAGGGHRAEAALRVVVERPPRWALRDPGALTVEAGERAALRLAVSRDGLAGPVAVRFEGVPAGVRLADTTIPDGRDEADAQAVAEPDAEPGSRDVTVVASAGGSETRAVLRLTVVAAPPEGEAGRFAGAGAGVTCLALSPDGRRLLAGGVDGTVRVWDVATRAEVGRLRGHADWVAGLAFSPDGGRALSAGGANPLLTGDGALRLWDVAAGAEVRAFGRPAGWLRAAAFLPDGRRAVTGGDDRYVRLWDVAPRAEAGRPRGHADWIAGLAGHTAAVAAVAVSADRRALSGGLDGTARLWDLDRLKELKRLDAPGAAVRAVAFVPKGRAALLGGGDLPPGGRGGFLGLWDLDTGRERARFEGQAGPVCSVALSPDGGRVLSGGADGTVRLWEAGGGRPLRRFDGHAGEVTGVAFLPDGRRAVSAGLDGTVRLWQLPR
jgi:WD40 repeat protein